ncbi:MAG: aquaporin [Hyphomicrobium sp.]|uniref:aquaporin n=1 Tax=Hyphomicrobium sp. TaxID=82 RepID=UPI003D0A73E4
MGPLPQKLLAEALGTALLLATVIGSGIMGERLSGGIEGIALLGNTLATGAILFVLITMLAPLSGAHFNPAVTAVMVVRRELSMRDGAAYIAVQVIAAIVGVIIAHGMFEQPLFQLSEKMRAGSAQGFSEVIATFGLVAVILLTRRARSDAVPLSVALYITAAYWFTASTSFANPAVTIARGFSNTFAGIRLEDVALFIAAQLAGAVLAMVLCAALTAKAGARETTGAARPAE